MRAVILSMLASACYHGDPVAPCTLTCASEPCPDGLTCMSDQICQRPGMPLCSTIAPDGSISGDAIAVVAPSADKGDLFGHAIALSGDGNWLFVGAPGEASNAAGIDGNGADNSLMAAGAVFVFRWDGSTYVLSSYIKSPAPDARDEFGYSIAVSTDGNTLAVGARGEDGSGPDATGDPNNDTSMEAGAAFLYERATSASPWMLTRYLKAPAPTPVTFFGTSVALSGDGDSLAVGSPGNARVIRFELSPTYSSSVFSPSTAVSADLLGATVALSRDGETMIAGMPLDDGAGTGFSGSASDNGSPDAGAIYIAAPTVTMQYGKASNTDDYDRFGTSVATNDLGNVIAVGAPQEDGGAGGIGASQTDETAPNAGAVYLAVVSGAPSAWMHTHFFKPTTPAAGDNFGTSVALSLEGDILVVGAPGAANQSGVVDMFVLNSTIWQPQARLGAATVSGERLGASVAISSDGSVVAAGAPSGNAGPVDNTPGAVYVFR
jgi:hypothetical protein